jgi:hypothetical protein
MSNENLNEIFFPHHHLQLKRVEDDELNFAHYTNADTAYKIIKNQEVWLRKVTVMNDYREFEHGKDCLIRLIDTSPEGQLLKDAFDAINPTSFESAYSSFKNWSFYIKDDFYISCFSEHIKIEEMGKLSMWRAYGGSAGVAIIFKQDFFRALGNSGLDFSNIAYLNEDKLKLEIVNLSNSISKNKATLKNIPKTELENRLLNIFRFSALCNKHKGFEEEREWRLIATASTLPKSNLTYQDIVTVQGTPQNIVKINLKSANFENLKFKDMIEKIIIGPSQHPYEIYKSIVYALKYIGAEQPENMVTISDIPLRLNH